MFPTLTVFYLYFRRQSGRRVPGPRGGPLPATASAGRGQQPAHPDGARQGAQDGRASDQVRAQEDDGRGWWILEQSLGRGGRGQDAISAGTAAETGVELEVRPMNFFFFFNIPISIHSVPFLLTLLIRKPLMPKLRFR